MSVYSDGLTTAWMRYDAIVFDRLKGLQRPEKSKGTLRLYRNVNRLLFEAVEDLEKSGEFSQLLQAVRSEEIAEGFHKKSDRSFWEHALTNVLRRSGYYLDQAGYGENLPDSLLSKIMSHFDRREKVITYLAPMEYVRLEINEIPCDTFSIKKFTEAELDRLFEIFLCEVFYPWAVVDTATLSDYWFIVMTDKQPINPLGRIDANLGKVGKVRARYSPFPKIERAIHALALASWQPDWTRHDDTKGPADWKGWLGFRVPFLLRYSDHLLDSPSVAPNLSTLDREPYFNPLTGEEEGEKPVHWISFSAEESEQFVNTVQNLDHLLVAIKPAMEAWNFVGRALGFLVKGFYSDGLEQLLWHMTVLEALFGEDRPGISKRLRRRIGTVLASTEAERREIGSRFAELYEFRSRLVHGDEFEQQVWAGHLREARDLARRCLLWFLNLAQLVIQACSTDLPDGIPKREEIMALIDLDPNAIDRMAKVIALAPPVFPAIKAWTR